MPREKYVNIFFIKVNNEMLHECVICLCLSVIFVLFQFFYIAAKANPQILLILWIFVSKEHFMDTRVIFQMSPQLHFLFQYWNHAQWHLGATPKGLFLQFLGYYSLHAELVFLPLRVACLCQPCKRLSELAQCDW